MITACATSQNLEFVTCKLQILSTSIEHSFCFKTHSDLSRILQYIFKIRSLLINKFVRQQHATLLLQQGYFNKIPNFAC
jgi:hypothetical protein